MPIIEIASSVQPLVVEATSDAVVSQLWFKTDAIDCFFAYRAVQLQLVTDSSDQGHSDSRPGSWSWFELGLYKDKDALEPIEKDGKAHVWKSHGNRIDPFDSRDTVTRHFGVVFDRRKGLFDALEIGNVIGVRVCAQYKGWINHARTGRLIAKVLDEDIFTPMSWTLSSRDISNDAPESIQDGAYCLAATTACHVKSRGDEQEHVNWFTSPIFNAETIRRVEDIQLFTRARQEGQPAADSVGNWCWFDLVILPTPEATVPKTKDGRSLVWRSHHVPRDTVQNADQIGTLFGRNHELLSFLEPGNVVAVRACARFPGWELHAKSGRLVIRISYKGVLRVPPKQPVDWKQITLLNQRLQASLEQYLNAKTPEGKPAALSVETTLLSQELRTDRRYGVGEKPLRLLSLDGGGVRGISALHILWAVMEKMKELTGDPQAKPCEYFDMMAGTSTGGLIAIMLGRLRMTVEQCITAYTDLAKDIFKAGILSKTMNVSTTGARYAAETLETAIKKVIRDHSATQNPDEPMLDPLPDACPVFVAACRADDLSNRVATHLRTYINKNVEKSFADYKIWEAARATSAAPTYFPRMKLDGYEYVDGGLGFNNPVLLLMGEARLHFGFARPIGTLITIGTGIDPNISISEATNPLNMVSTTRELIMNIMELAMKGEHANKMAEPLCEKGTYFRFNVGKKISEKRWVENVNPSWLKKMVGETPTQLDRFTPENWERITIDLADYAQMDTFLGFTKAYLEVEDEKTRVKSCAAKLPPRRAMQANL